MLGRRLLRLRFGHQRDNPVECAVTGRPCRDDLECPLAVHGARKDVVAGAFVDRHGFTCDGRLVHRRLATLDAAVNGHTFARPNQH